MTTLVIALLIAVLVVAAIYIPRFFLRKAMRDVVLLFRQKGATGPTTATTPEELGLVRGSLLDRAFRLRDYRPDALGLLRQADIIRSTEEGRLYLSEESLERSRVKTFARIE